MRGWKNVFHTSGNQKKTRTTILISEKNTLKIKTATVQVRCTILGAWGWCTEMTRGDGMGREEGRGFSMGNTYIPVAGIHFDVWQHQHNIVKLKNKIK